MKATNEIRRRQLRKLGLMPLKKELELHNKISDGQYVGGINAKQKIEKWMNKLSGANKKTKIFPEEDLTKVLEQKKKEAWENYDNHWKNFGVLTVIDMAAAFVGQILRVILPEEVVDRLRKECVKVYNHSNKIRQNILGKYENIRARYIKNIMLVRTVPKKFKIGFAVLAHERPEYLEVCLNSLFRTNLHNYDVTFLISDDGSQDPRVKEIINKERDLKYKIVRNFTSKGHNSWAGAFNKAMRRLMKIDDFNIIGSCDSDALFHPEWLDKTMKICLWAKAHHKDHVLGPFSSFNSSDWKFHNILGTYMSPFGGYVVKERMGAVNYLYFKDDFLKLGFYPETVHDETLMTEKLKKSRIRYFSTETSYVEHIGQKSTLNQWRPVPVRKAVYGLNLAKGDWGMDMEKISPYGYYKYLKKIVGFGSGKTIKSDLEVDIIIPAIKKDLDVLPLTVESVRKNLMHPMGKIYIVGPKMKELEIFCQNHDCVLVDEDSVIPVKLKDINYKVKGLDRSGWIFQQFLKLSADKISSNDHFYIIDADNVLVQPQKFEHNGKFILLASDEYNIPYFETFRKIFKSEIFPAFSFVAHQMLFSKDKLQELREDIERKNNNKPWYQVIIDNLDPNEISSFSEYETYGNWMKKNYPENIMIEYWFNIFLPQKVENTLDYYSTKYGRDFRSVSLHSYGRSD